MSVQTPPVTPAPEPTPTPTTPTPPPAQETDWKAEARKWEQRAKENSDAAKRLAEIEEASKTEVQKLAERAQKAEKALAEREAEALRLRIASQHGITGDYLDLLNGSDEASLTAAATKLAALITPAQRKGAIGPYVPPEGATPAGGPLNGDPLLEALKEKLGIE